MSSSREYLDMDPSKSGSLTFKANNGFYLSKTAAAVLAVLFVASCILVGLLSYYLPECSYSQLAGKTDGVVSDNTTKPPLNVMLPTANAPLHYDVSLQPFLDGNFTFNGEVSMRFRVAVPSSNVTVHVNNISVIEDTVTVKDADGKTVAVASLERDEPRQFFIVKLKQNLMKDKEYTLSMMFVGLLNDDMAGFYRSSYNETINGRTVTKWLAVTQFQPTDARRAFPCMDEPALKATFSITLIRPNNMISLSNMDIARSEQRGNLWTADIYNKTVKMSTYLLAFVVADFINKESNTGGTKFRIWARKEAIDQTEYALQIGPRILKFYEQYFGTEFPLPKQDMIAIPDFRAGAMENWGLITYRETALLWDAKKSSTSNKQRVAAVVAHELAHQWFGNLVTPKWWDDLWLNEGFASYMEYVGTDHVEPMWNMMDQVLVDELQSVLDLDSLESSHPVSVTVNHPDEINEIFDSISYSKGASIIRMMEYFLTREKFTKGLSNYLNGLKFGSAVQDDLWAYLTNATNNEIQVKTIMDTWTKQTGYPVVNVTRDYAGQSAILSQKRFFLIDKVGRPTSETGTRWHIPITYYTEGTTDRSSAVPQLWFWKENETVRIDQLAPADKWVIFNLNETSYYRVSYDEENWKRLTNQLQNNHEAITPSNRAQILDDALNLARAGLLNYDTALNALLYLDKETEYVPWSAASGTWYFLDQMLQLTASYGDWTTFVKAKAGVVYDRIGFEDTETAESDHLKRFQRILIISWVCEMGYEPCVNATRTAYTTWMTTNNDSHISANLRMVVACNGIRYGGLEEWEFAWRMYLESNVGSEKAAMLSAMSCSQSLWILNRYLQMSLDLNSGIRKMDSSTVFNNVAANTAGRFLAFNILRDQWDVIKQLHGTGFFAISRMVKSVTATLNTQFELDELKEFVEHHKGDLGTATRSMEQAIEETEANVNWMKKNYAAVSTWLSKTVPLLKKNISK